MSSVARAGLLVLLLFTIGIAYAPGLSGPFIFDDSYNIMENRKVHIEEVSLDSIRTAVFSVRSGPLYRPFSMLSIALNYYWGGSEVWNYKIVNVIIHCLSTFAVFYLVFNLVRALALFRPDVNHFRTDQQWWVAFLVAALWGLHPLNLTSVLYVVQRMASLAGLFTFLATALYLQGRIALQQSKSGVGWYWLGAALVTVLGVFSKENAFLIPLFVALLEACLGRWMAPDRRWLLFFQSMRIVAFVGVISLGLLLIFFWNDLVDKYKFRPFTMEERLLTEPRVLWHYLSWSLVPDIRAMGVFHDDIAVSNGLLNPPTTLLSIVGILLTLLLAWFLLEKQPLMALSIFWFFTAHLMESTAIPLELVHEHRNYVALVGPILFLVMLLYLVAEKFHLRARVRVVCAFAFGIALMSQTYARSVSWESFQSLMDIELENHPKSTRVLYGNGRLWYIHIALADKETDKEKYYQSAKSFLERGYRNDEEELASLFGLIRLQLLMKRPVNMEWFDELELRLKKYSISGAKLKQLFELVECRLSGVCEVPFSSVHRVLAAALSNPIGIERSFHASLVSSQGALKWTEGEYAAAADYFREAFYIDPYEVFATSAINAYIESGDYDEARRFASESIGLSDEQIAKMPLVE